MMAAGGKGSAAEGSDGTRAGLPASLEAQAKVDAPDSKLVYDGIQSFGHLLTSEPVRGLFWQSDSLIEFVCVVSLHPWFCFGDRLQRAHKASLREIRA